MEKLKAWIYSRIKDEEKLRDIAKEHQDYSVLLETNSVIWTFKEVLSEIGRIEHEG